MISTKVIVIAAVAVVVVAAGAGAIVLMNQDKDKDDTKLDTAGYQGLVYGNANGDAKINDKDLEIIQSIMNDDAKLEDYPLADADKNGKVEQADYDFVKSIIDGTTAEGAVVYAIDVTGDAKQVPYPLTSIFFAGGVNGRTVANVLEVQNFIKCLATNDTYLNDIDHELMSVTNATGFSGSIPRISIDATEEDITTMTTTTFQAAVIEDGGITGYNNDSCRAFYGEIGAQVLRFNFDNAETSLQSVATLGILLKKTEPAANYVDLMESVIEHIKTSAGDVYGTRTVMGVTMSNSLSGTQSDYYAATQLAGGKNLADWPDKTKKFTPANGDTWLYEAKYNAQYMFHFKSMAGNTLDMDEATIKSNLENYSQYFSETTMFKSGGYYLLNGLIPLPARVAYMGETMYSDKIEAGYGASVFQDFVNSFTDLKDWKATDHKVIWSFKDGSGYVPATSVTLSEHDLTLGLNNEKTLTYTLNEGATDNTPVWTSSNTDVATVSLGVINTIAPGTATITISSGNATDTCTITVQDIAPTAIVLSSDSVSMGLGGRSTLTYSVLPENANVVSVSLSSSDETKVTVGDGIITAVATGSVTITATAGELTDTCTVTVGDTAPTGATWTAGMTDGKTYKTMRGTTTTTYVFEFTLTPADACVTNLSVVSSNDAIVVVTDYSVLDGVVTVNLERIDTSTKAGVNIVVKNGSTDLCSAQCRCNGWSP